MPQVVTAVAVWVASYFGGSAIVAYAVEAAIYYAAGRFFYSRDDAGIPRGQIPLNSRLQYLKDPNAPHTIVYGEATFAPAVVADFSDKKNLYMLLALTPHDIEEIVSIRVNDEDFFTDEEVGLVNKGLLTRSFDNNYNPIYRPNIFVMPNSDFNDSVSELRARVGVASRTNGIPIFGMTCDKQARASGRLGEVSRPDGVANWWSNILADMERFTPAQFGSDGNGQTPTTLGMKMSGLSWVMLTLPRSRRVTHPTDTNADVWNSVPVITFRVRRANSTLRLPAGFDISGYSRGNSALCAYDYLARYTDYANPVCGVDRIDASNLAAAAQFCEDRNLTCDGVIRLDQAPADVMEQIGFALNGGVFTETAGIRKIVPGAPAATTRVITDEDIVDGTWAYSPMADVNSRVSEIVCKYMDEDGTEQSAGAAHRDAPFTSSQTIQLDLVNNRAQAESVARIMLSRIWNGATLKFSLLDPTLDVRPYDLIRVKGGGPLDLADVFRVLSIERTTEGRLNVQCIYEDPSLFEPHALDGIYIPPARLPNYIPEGAADTFRVLINSGGDRLKVRPAGAEEASFVDYR